MRAFLIFTAALFSFIVTPSMAGAQPASISEQVILEHGGGCRKSSPPGKCCHMDNRAGKVHCH
ncbi:hypothetical protein [Thauera aromatica]|uniref:hypothetical protein n=1 Tax=Thauera aromatica TaxID=59405 RepID=UPI000D16F2BC|nr:hypothetical protein [Thauera aromatica]